MVPRTSPSFSRARAGSPRKGFSLRSKVRLALVSTTLFAVLMFRVLHTPLQAWLEVYGAAGRLLILGALCLPTLFVLAWHSRRSSS